MKVLLLANYIYKKGLPGFEKNKTGFGIMVRGIAESVAAAGNEVFTVTGVFTEERNDGFVIPRRSKWDVLKHFRPMDVISALPEILGSHLSFKEVLHQIYYQMGLGFIRHFIKTEKPDVVHIHGMGYASYKKILLCQKMGVPVVLTAHGLLEHDPDAGEFDKKWERILFAFSEKEQIPTSVISSGMAHRLLNSYYGLSSKEHISIITNGICVKKKEPLLSVREELNVSPETRICLGVGFVGERKNQIQILRAVALLPEEKKKMIHVVLAGIIADGYPIAEEAERLGIADRVHILGFVDESKIPSYYREADLVILASQDEGFGLSLVEGYVYGKPCVTFADLDAAEDIAADFSTVLCPTRKDEDFAAAISFALEKEWDSGAIESYSEKFSLERMAEKYISFYKKAIDN